MRALLPALVGAFSLLAVFQGANGVGGVLVTGAGIGTSYPTDGSPVCTDHMFSPQAFYLPGGNGLLRITYLMTGECPLENGGALFGPTVTVPPGQPGISFSCHGTEAAGLECTGMTELGEPLWAMVGPYEGLGKTVSIQLRLPYAFFEGSFMAT